MSDQCSCITEVNCSANSSYRACGLFCSTEGLLVVLKERACVVSIPYPTFKRNPAILLPASSDGMNTFHYIAGTHFPTDTHFHKFSPLRRSFVVFARKCHLCAAHLHLKEGLLGPPTKFTTLSSQSAPEVS